MLLCNLNQTVITASSDRTIHAWSPHSPSAAPSLIGRHRDYVKSLAWAKYPSLLFSGALDRQVAIWDVGAGHHETPLLSIDLNKADEWGGVGLEGERGSVYALGVDPTGRILAAGTPERVVRLWDPRVGDKTIAKLVGHSDCVRSVIVSEDGKHMLTGSSDSTIKLWSLAAHRCLHTFNHHTSSVWSLFSNHPTASASCSLERGTTSRERETTSPSRATRVCVASLGWTTNSSGPRRAAPRSNDGETWAAGSLASSRMTLALLTMSRYLGSISRSARCPRTVHCGTSGCRSKWIHR